MTTELIARAKSGDEDAFAELVNPYRRELQLHCYRILGSAHDAEDALQEALLAAWRGLNAFQGRASVRTWLYRVATSRCLDALRAQRKRPQLDAPMPHWQLPEPTRQGEVLWLEPYPDLFLEGIADSAPGPEARYETREAVSLAFVTALQLLPPRQRAVLILRDVMGFHAGEVARMLDSSNESVTSALKRARATLESQNKAKREAPPPPNSDIERRIVERFTLAFEGHDVTSIVALLTEDVLVTMPPTPVVYQGQVAARQFLQAVFLWQGPPPRLLATRANGQPAFGIYIREPRVAVLHAVGLLVLSLSGDGICGMTRFDTSVLGAFGLARTVLE